MEPFAQTIKGVDGAGMDPNQAEGTVRVKHSLTEWDCDEYEFVVHPRGHGPTLFAGYRSMST